MIIRIGIYFMFLCAAASIVGMILQLSRENLGMELVKIFLNGVVAASVFIICAFTLLKSTTKND